MSEPLELLVYDNGERVVVLPPSDLEPIGRAPRMGFWIWTPHDQGIRRLTLAELLLIDDGKDPTNLEAA